MYQANDGFSLTLPPLGWARICKHQDHYSYSARGMAPVLSDELELLIEVCAERGYELFADDNGLRVERADAPLY